MDKYSRLVANQERSKHHRQHYSIQQVHHHRDNKGMLKNHQCTFDQSSLTHSIRCYIAMIKNVISQKPPGRLEKNCKNPVPRKPKSNQKLFWIIFIKYLPSITCIHSNVRSFKTSQFFCISSRGTTIAPTTN